MSEQTDALLERIAVAVESANAWHNWEQGHGKRPDMTDEEWAEHMAKMQEIFDRPKAPAKHSLLDWLRER